MLCAIVKAGSADLVLLVGTEDTIDFKEALLIRDEVILLSLYCKRQGMYMLFL